MELNSLFKLLSDDTRIRVTYLLYQEELCVCQLSGITGIAQPKISKAISKLKSLNLVCDRREDKFVFYKLKESNPLLSTILSSIQESVSEHPQLENDQKELINKEAHLTNCSGVVTIK
jgi:ArsR family transcriptional regulator